MTRATKNRLTRYATGLVMVDRIGVFEDGQFANRYVAKVGGAILAVKDRPHRFDTVEEARAFGEWFQQRARDLLFGAASVSPAGEPNTPNREGEG